MYISDIHAHLHFEAAFIGNKRHTFLNISDFLETYNRYASRYSEFMAYAFDLISYINFELENYNIKQNLVFVDIDYLPNHLNISLDDFGRQLKSIERMTSRNQKVKFIPCILRHLNQTHANKTLEFVEKHDFFAIGLAAGPEKTNPPFKFKDQLKEAKLKGKQLILHSGEEIGTASHIEECLELNVDRIGHGIQIFQENRQDLIQELIKRNIPIDLCPISNKLMGVVKEYPAKAILESGIDFTINTDDPGIFGCSLLDNKKEFFSFI